MNFKQGKTLNLGLIDYKPFLDKYKKFEDSFNDAYIGIPKSLTGSEHFYGSLRLAKEEIPETLAQKNNLKSIMYMEGSGPFSKGETFRKWIVEAGYVFFSPHSYASKDRPKYVSPIPKENYEEIHAYRQAEITLFIDKLSKVPFINKEHMFLMGNSEGGLAAARYNGKEFKGRIVLSYSCEPGYYSDYAIIGAHFNDDPFLNIMGRDDAFFGAHNVWNRAYQNKGHAADALFRFKNAKVVILPNTGHDVMSNQFTKEEIISFINRF